LQRNGEVPTGITRWRLSGCVFRGIVTGDFAEA
jgi:hypothetical protein